MSRIRFALGLVALAIASLILILPATAADKGGTKRIASAEAPSDAATWTGVYFGLHGGYGIGTGELSNSSGGGFVLDGLSAEGMIGGLHVGYDVQLPGSQLVLRARGSYTWGSVEFNASAGKSTFEASVDKNWAVDGGIGYAMGAAMPYLFIGKAWAESSASLNGTALKTPDLEGMRYGGGVEWKLGTSGISAALEYTFTDYDALTFGKTVLDFDDHRVMGRLNFKLPSGGVAIFK